MTVGPGGGELLPPWKPILLLVLERSTAGVVVAAALGTVPVVVGPCGLLDLLAISGPLGLSGRTLLVALLGRWMAPDWEFEILSASRS